MCGAMLAMIIFVLGLLKFPVTLNSFTRFPSYTKFIFAAISYRSSSSCCSSLTDARPCCCSLASSFVAAGSSLSASFSIHIPYSPSSCYTVKKQYHVRSAAFLQVRLVLLPRVLILRCIILRLYFSKMCSSFITRLWEIFWKFYGHTKTTFELIL